MSVYERYIEQLESNSYIYNEEFKDVLEEISNSTAIYNGHPVDTLFMPKFFSEDKICKMNMLIDRILIIIDKVIREYIENATYQKLFPFNQEIKELILTEHGYKSLLPMARIDFFYNEDTDDFKFCEFNTDGTSAMNEDRELVRIFSETSIHKEMETIYHLESFELIDSWVDEVIKIYSGSKYYQKDSPTIAIIDFLDKATIDEFRIFQKQFEKKGYKTIIVDIREVEFNQESLWFKGIKIDIVYRRAVTSEMDKHRNQIIEFIKACKSGQVCIIGPLKTQVVHHKLIFKILHQNQTRKFLSQDENDFIKKHIPYTEDLTRNNRDKVIEEKNRWIIKPIDSYGSKGVYAGLDFTKSQWQDLVLKTETSDYLVQEYCKPYESLLPVFKDGSLTLEKFNNITGVYIYNGKMKGILSRVGQKAVISGINKGYTLPTFEVKKN